MAFKLHRSFCLELDGFTEGLKLTFEYEGIQHYEIPKSIS